MVIFSSSFGLPLNSSEVRKIDELGCTFLRLGSKQSLASQSRLSNFHALLEPTIAVGFLKKYWRTDIFHKLFSSFFSCPVIRFLLVLPCLVRFEKSALMWPCMLCPNF